MTSVYYDMLHIAVRSGTSCAPLRHNGRENGFTTARWGHLTASCLVGYAADKLNKTIRVLW